MYINAKYSRMKQMDHQSMMQSRKMCPQITYCSFLLQISYFKIPKYVEVLEDFPKTASGKIQKYKLREEMEKKLKRNIW